MYSARPLGSAICCRSVFTPLIEDAADPAGGELGRERRFLAEWYRPEVTGATVDDVVGRLRSAAAERPTVRVLVALSVPSDEVFYCLYAAESADDVRAACTRAGIPAERITSDVHARIEGAAVHDLALTFDQRWQRSGGGHTPVNRAGRRICFCQCGHATRQGCRRAPSGNGLHAGCRHSPPRSCQRTPRPLVAPELPCCLRDAIRPSPALPPCGSGFRIPACDAPGIYRRSR